MNDTVDDDQSMSSPSWAITISFSTSLYDAVVVIIFDLPALVALSS